MEKINRVKLAKIENYLHDQEIWHESIDVQEQPVGGVLAQYGIVEELTTDEKEYLRSFLYRKARREEIAEAVQWAKALEEEAT